MESRGTDRCGDTSGQECHAKGSQQGTAVPLQAWSDPEGSRKLRFQDFVTTAQEGGKVVRLSRLPPGNSPGTHFC